MPQFSDSLQPYLVNAQVSPSRSLCLLSVLTNNPGPPRAGGEECKNIFLVFISIGGVEEVSLKAQPLLSALLTCCWNSDEGGRHLCHCLSSPWLPFYPSTFSPFIILPHAFMMAHLLTSQLSKRGLVFTLMWSPSAFSASHLSSFCPWDRIQLPVPMNLLFPFSTGILAKSSSHSPLSDIVLAHSRYLGLMHIVLLKVDFLLTLYLGLEE